MDKIGECEIIFALLYESTESQNWVDNTWWKYIANWCYFHYLNLEKGQLKILGKFFFSKYMYQLMKIEKTCDILLHVFLT